MLYHEIFNRNIRLETITWTIDIDSGVGLQTYKDIQLDTNYDTCLGVAVYARSTSSTKDLLLGISHLGTDIHDLSPKANWIANTAVRIEDHYKPLKFFPQNGKITLKADLLEDNSDAAHTLYFVFVLANTKQQ